MAAELTARQNESAETAARRHNLLVKFAQANTLVSGDKNVRMRRTPHGTFIDFDGAEGAGGSSPFFRASIKRKGAEFEMRFLAGFIGGVKPTIDGTPIDKKGDDGKTPALIVKPGDFDPDEGIAGIYFRVTVDGDFAVAKVEPMAAPSKPLKEPWRAHKLAGFLFQKSGKYDRHLVSNLNFYAANRTKTGNFDALWPWGS